MPPEVLVAKNYGLVFEALASDPSRPGRASWCGVGDARGGGCMRGHRGPLHPDWVWLPVRFRVRHRGGSGAHSLSGSSYSSLVDHRTKIAPHGHRHDDRLVLNRDADLVSAAAWDRYGDCGRAGRRNPRCNHRHLYRGPVRAGGAEQEDHCRVADGSRGGDQRLYRLAAGPRRIDGEQRDLETPGRYNARKVDRTESRGKRTLPEQFAILRSGRGHSPPGIRIFGRDQDSHGGCVGLLQRLQRLETLGTEKVLGVRCR